MLPLFHALTCQAGSSSPHQVAASESGDKSPHFEIVADVIDRRYRLNAELRSKPSEFRQQQGQANDGKRCAAEDVECCLAA